MSQCLTPPLRDVTAEVIDGSSPATKMCLVTSTNAQWELGSHGTNNASEWLVGW
jgi:hypothetical protein